MNVFEKELEYAEERDITVKAVDEALQLSAFGYPADMIPFVARKIEENSLGAMVRIYILMHDMKPDFEAWKEERRRTA